jgi:hypothetical protein
MISSTSSGVIGPTYVRSAVPGSVIIVAYSQRNEGFTAVSCPKRGRNVTHVDRQLTGLEFTRTTL